MTAIATRRTADESQRRGLMDESERIWRERGLRRAVLAGDEDAWRVLYGENYQLIYDYVHVRTAKRTDVTDELVQDVWLHAVRRIGRFDPARGSFEAWLRGIARNVLRNYYRRRRPLQLADDSEVDAMDDAMSDDRDASEWIALAMVELPGDYQRVLDEKYNDERSVVEIAERWNRSPKSIESLLSRARAALRAAYLRITTSSDD